MKLSVAKFGLLVMGVALMLLAIAPGTAQPTAAAVLAVITPTEPATFTPVPSNTPVQPTATRTPPPNAPETPVPTKPPSSEPKNADPALTKAINISHAEIGDEIIFTITVTNNGPHTAEDVVVTDSIADYLDVIEATTTRGSVSSDGRTVFVNIGPVPVGDEITIRIRVRLNERAQPPSGRNRASLTTSSPGDDPSNNVDEVPFTIGTPVGTPTATPVATVDATPMATLAPTPAPPVRLPVTGAADQITDRATLFAMLGLLSISLSLLLHFKARSR